MAPGCGKPELDRLLPRPGRSPEREDIGSRSRADVLLGDRGHSRRPEPTPSPQAAEDTPARLV